jgi:thiamine-phosphate pyrophosphorylase
VLVAITDRRLMVDGALLATGDWAAIARAFGAAIARVTGAAIVQVREKDLDGGPLLALARAAVATGARVMVNDRLDVALAAGAHGVHLPERGLAIDVARRLAPGLAIGASRHTVDGAAAAAAAGAQLVQLGPIWDTPHKGPPLGPAALGAARDAIAGRAQLVAVCGIDGGGRAREARRAGADAVAAIRAVWSGALRGDDS